MRKGNKQRSPPTRQDWAGHHRGSHLGPASNPPEQGGGKRGSPGCGRTLGAPALPPALLGPSLFWRLHGGMLRWFWLVSYFISAKPTSLQYKQMDGAYLQHTPHLSSTPHTTPCTLLLLVVFQSQAKLCGELGHLGDTWYEKYPKLPYGLALIYQCSYAYELEQSSYVISLAYESLCLIIHTTYMIRLRSKLRWQFVVPSGRPLSYACC